jgi:hypothetical protein
MCDVLENLLVNAQIEIGTLSVVIRVIFPHAGRGKGDLTLTMRNRPFGRSVWCTCFGSR